MTIPIEQAKGQLEALIARCARGEEVVITQDGRPVARVVGPSNGHSTSAWDREDDALAEASARLLGASLPREDFSDWER